MSVTFDMVGLDMKAYYGVAGAKAATLLTNIKDLSLSATRGEADNTTRATQGYKTSVPTLIEAEVTFDMVWKPSDAGFTAIRTAFFGKQPIALAVLDGLGEGMDADWMISSFSRNEALEDVVTVSVTAKPTMITRAPAWIVPEVTP